jgi:hypothetical protein
MPPASVSGPAAASMSTEPVGAVVSLMNRSTVVPSVTLMTTTKSGTKPRLMLTAAPAPVNFPRFICMVLFLPPKGLAGSGGELPRRPSHQPV